MFNLFKKKKEEVDYRVFAPIKGEVIELTEVPDPVFAQKMLGDGVAINPAEGVVYSPVNGEIVQVFDTKHAIGIKGETGIELLIHVGLETVALKGEGFTTFVKPGQSVKVGQKLLEFDLETIKEKAKSMITPVVITNSEQEQYNIEKNYGTANDNQYVVMEVKK
ncbi:PTS glucose transporter subunit IIA [Alkalicella caledoniensis]|uniref:PTS glucose transporter subunit IIA n=1 Tax=Alkalicella caledoniensis TaxID=2731377 RepID=A0A7G9W979_ALKCA|nr:PTS glucose transporter subunit IIA [Alkalicella caledoniensis]